MQLGEVKKTKREAVLGVLVAKLVLPTLPFAGYLSALILSGIITGCVTGLIAWEIFRRIGLSGGRDIANSGLIR